MPDGMPYYTDAYLATLTQRQADEDRPAAEPRNFYHCECGRDYLNPGDRDMCNTAHLGYDPVERPSHYTQAAIECIDAIEAALTPEEFRGYCKGNALKYVWREKRKGGDEDARKALWYLRRLTGDRRA